MTKSDNNGYILITVLLLLLVLTIVGMAAINTSTIENVLSGNVRLRDRNISKADAGAEISAGLIEHVARDSDIQGFTNIVSPNFTATDPNYLPTELRVTVFDTDTQDLAFSVDGQNVTVDIDKMYAKNIPGNANLFAAASEGAGSGAGGKYIFYRINATGTGLALSNANVGNIYRYVPK